MCLSVDRLTFFWPVFFVFFSVLLLFFKYFCGISPPFLDFKSLSLEWPPLLLCGLQVLKPGVGMVVFHGLTDCRDLDVARDIVLKRGYVLVYPDQTLRRLEVFFGVI